MARTLSIDSDATSWPSLNLKSLRLTDDQFLRLCRDNDELRLELTAEGELIIMPPAGGETGWRESKILQRLANWTEGDGTGICFSSNMGARLPNSAIRSPDASWMPLSRWKRLTREQQKKLAPMCPDFVVELRSPSDRLPALQKKMTEYIENGARLSWLLDPDRKRAYIYRPGKEMECLENPDYLSGEDVLPGFKFNFQEIL